MRLLICCFAALVATESAQAGTPAREKDWDLLIAEAKKHGGSETSYETTISYVFQKPDGSYVTFTRTVDNQTRAVCVISKSQTVTVCGNWDTGKLKYSWRADAASPWTVSDNPPAAEGGPEKGPLASALSALADVFGAGLKGGLHK